MKRVVIVDPPKGWQYGFPAPLEDTLEKTLKKYSYPQELWELARKYSRYWVENTDAST